MQELLLKLDRAEQIVAQQVATGPEYKQTDLVEPVHPQDQPATSSSFAAYGQSPPLAQVELPASFQSFVGQTSSTNQEEDHYEYEFETDSEDEFDHALYDDDGERLVDEQRETLIPF